MSPATPAEKPIIIPAAVAAERGERSCASTINIGNCYIDDIPGGSAAYRIPASTLVPAYGFWTLDRSNYFNNSGDAVRLLKEDASTVLDSYTFGGSSPDLSWYRFPDGGSWAGSPTLSPTKGFSNSPSVFEDVPSSYWAWSFIERLYRAGITGGCNLSPLRCCPEGIVNRAQMAVFLERGIHGSLYAPPDVGAGTGFADVPSTYWSAAWIKQLAADGITVGCGNGNYCPEGSVNRAQMAVFLLKGIYGSSFAPPAVNGSTGFIDVATTHWAAARIKHGE